MLHSVILVKTYKNADLKSGDGNSRLRLKYHKEIALTELDLMHQAIDEGDLKKAKHHKIIASDAIDEMISASQMVEMEE